MTPVVFLHGIGGGAKSFAPQIASFASAGYQPVALDLQRRHPLLPDGAVRRRTG